MPQQVFLVPDYIRREAEAQGLDPAIALAVAEKESNFDPSAIGSREVVTNGVRERAVGTFQFLPSTATSRGFDPNDIEANVREGVRYLKELLDRHQDPHRALAEYGGVIKDTEYIPDVLQRIKKYQLQGSQSQTGATTPATTPAAAGAATTPAAAPRERAPWGRTTEVPADIAAQLAQIRAQKAGPPAPPWYAPGGDVIGDRLRSTAHAYDPRERQGRRNIAATAGAIVATPAILATAPFAGAGALTGMAVGALSSGAFGAVQEGVEQIGEYAKGQRTQADPWAIAGAGGEQALMDVAGHGILAPGRWTGRALVGRPVMTEIAESLAKDRALILGHMQALKDFYKTGARTFFKQQADVGAAQTFGNVVAKQGAQDAKRLAVEQARDAAASTLGRARTVTRRNVAVGEEIARGDVSAAQAAADEAQRDLAERFQITIGPPHEESVIGREVAGVFDDPLAREADALGAAVDEAARTGPPLDPTSLQDEARRMAMEEILPPEREFPRVVGEPPPAPPGAAPDVSTGIIDPTTGRPFTRAADPPTAGPPAPPEIDPLLLAEVTAAERAGMAKHPVMQTIVRILQHQGPVDFFTLHQWKKQLGATLDFDDPLSNIFEGARKHLFSRVRQMLAVHEPYNVATQAYDDILETTAKGYGEQVAKNAVPEPARILQMINPRDPHQTSLLMNALERHGPQVADSVRAAWLHRNVLQGGLDTLPQRMRVLHDNPEFTRSLFGSTRNTVLDTLDSWVAAWERGGAETAERVAGAERLGRTRLEAATQLGEDRLAQTREGTTAATRAAAKAGEANVRDVDLTGRRQAMARGQTVRDARYELATNLGMLSTDMRLVKEVSDGEAIAIANSSKRAGEIYDLVYASMRPTGPRGVIGLIRTLSGPKSAELLAAAAADPNVNRLLVDWLADPNTRLSYQVVKRLLGQEAVEHGPDAYQALKEQKGAGKPLWEILGVPNPLPQ